MLICTCASLEAQGDLERLDPAIRQALDGGVTVNELKEAFSQLYAYTGFPRSLNALGTLQKVLNDRKAKGINDDEGKPFDYDFCPQDDYYLKSHLFGDIFASDQLSASDRELVTVAALSSMKGVEPQLAAHKGGAVNMGNTKEQVDCSADANAGDWPKGNPNEAYARYFIGNSHLAPVQPANLADAFRIMFKISLYLFGT